MSRVEELEKKLRILKKKESQVAIEEWQKTLKPYLGKFYLKDLGNRNFTLYKVGNEFVKGKGTKRIEQFIINPAQPFGRKAWNTITAKYSPIIAEKVVYWGKEISEDKFNSIRDYLSLQKIKFDLELDELIDE